MNATRRRYVFSGSALLLAILLSARVGWTANKAAREDRPQILAQLGHSHWVTSVAFSPDGRWVLSGGFDRALKLWDVSSRREIRTFARQPLWVMSVAFSPDGKRALSGGNDNMLKLWDVSSGREIHTFEGHAGYVRSVAFSADGRLALSGSNDKMLKLWDVSSGREIRTFKGHTGGVTFVALSPDGQRALSVGGDYMRAEKRFVWELKLWDVSSGREIRAFKGHRSRVNSVAFSPDGKLALSGGNGSTLRLWDVSSGREIRTFKGHRGSVHSVAFSPDGQWALSGSHDKTLKLWDVSSGREIRTFEGHADAVTSVAFSPDGRWALSGSYDKTLKLWDVSSGREVCTFKGLMKAVYSVGFSPDGQRALSGGDGKTLRLWDVSSRWQIRTFEGHTMSVNSVAFSPDGRLALSGGGAYMRAKKRIVVELKLWDVSSGREIRTFKEHAGGVTSVAFSPDGQWALSGSSDKTLKLWDVSSGRQIRTFKGHADDVWSVAFSPDGRRALSGGKDMMLKQWDVSSGREIRTFEGRPGRARSVAFSPDGQWALSGGVHGKLKLWDVSSGREIRRFKGHSQWVNSVAFSRDGKLALSGGSDHTVKLWDVSSGREIRTFRGHTGWVSSVAFSPDGKRVLSGSRDGTLRLWGMATGQEIAALAAGEVDGSEEWLAWTPDGYFDSSRCGGELVHAVKGLRVFGIDQLALRNNRPDIILRRLRCGNEALIDHFRQLYAKRLRRSGVTEEQLTAGYHVPDAKILESRQDGKFVQIRFALSDERCDLKRYNVYVNDVPLFGAYGKPVEGRAATLTERIELTSGPNKIEVTCMNVAGAESWRAMTTAQYDEEVLGDLYFIGFGVSKYRDQRLNLRYAHKDAEDLARLVRGTKGKYRNAHVKTFLDEEVTVENIKNAKRLLKDARVDDTFVLFIAGHGVYDRAGEATYYFLTHGADTGNLSATAADFDLIEDLLQGIAPRRKLFLMDTCESGELEEDTRTSFVAMAQTRGIRLRTARGPGGIAATAAHRRKPRPWLHERDRYIYNDLLRRSGAIVFSSCKGGEMSCESDKAQNGFFTEAIINALTSPPADRDGDKVVSTKELRDYVSNAVSEWTGGCQHPTVDRDNIFMKFGLPLTR